MNFELPQLYRAIVQGKLDFGTHKSYETILKMYQYRLENYHKEIILFKPEDVFKEETNSLEIERYVNPGVYEKSFKATADLLKYCAQFAINGSIRAWLVDDGQIMHFHNFEPSSDKKAVRLYKEGKQLVKVEGRQEEAITRFTKAIEKYDNHAQAYERRAKTCFVMKKYADALRDYNKALAIDPTMPHAYYGRARTHLVNNDLQNAIEDFDQAIKKSLALESIHWKSRRLKGIAHVDLEQYSQAVFELKLYTKRPFEKSDTNFFWKRLAWYNYSKALIALNENEEAIKALDEAIALPEQNDRVETFLLYRMRGVAKKQAGKNGFAKDLKAASDMGDKAADTILKELRGKG